MISAFEVNYSPLLRWAWNEVTHGEGKRLKMEQGWRDFGFLMESFFGLMSL